LFSILGGRLVEDQKIPERLKKQLEFALEIDKEKNITRQTHLSGQGRAENDAEHAWHMAIMAYLLAEYSNEPVDIKRVMIMCLIHDIVEIDAGDTYAYDTEGKVTQKEREDAAAKRIYSLLPEDQAAELMSIFREFEEGESAEAKFARAMDNLQPLILNDSNGGSDWVAHGVKAQQVYGRQERTKEGSEELYDVTDRILKKYIQKGIL
jgi:putative hydrolase of HD superfamily